MFFLIKFFILALFLVAFFFIPVGSKPLYDHLRAIGKTAPAQELKQDFVKNLIQLETWAKSHKALMGETMPGHQDPPEPDMAENPARKEKNDMGVPAKPAPDMAAPADAMTSPEKPRKPAGIRKPPAMRSLTPDGETP